MYITMNNALKTKTNLKNKKIKDLLDNFLLTKIIIMSNKNFKVLLTLPDKEI